MTERHYLIVQALTRLRAARSILRETREPVDMGDGIDGLLATAFDAVHAAIRRLENEVEKARDATERSGEE